MFESFLQNDVSSILVGADDLAAVAGRESLIDAVKSGRSGCRPSWQPPGHCGDQPRVPRVDRVLDEPDRAIAEGEVAAAGVIAGGCVGEVALTRDDLGPAHVAVSDWASLRSNSVGRSRRRSYRLDRPMSTN